jgi:diacylglycerol O-acyltransferase / wax synthase
MMAMAEPMPPQGVPLSEEDHAILELECPTVAGHTMKVVVIGEGAPSVDRVRERVAERIDATPQLTWRLGGSDGAPVWVPDPRFDPAAHVIEVAGEIDRAELPRAAAEVFERRLSRERPLWRIDAFGLRDGGRALIWRLHHALADGTAAMRFARGLLWDASGGSGRDRPTPPHAPHAHPDQQRRRGHLAAFLRREFAESVHRPPFDAEIGTRRAIEAVAVPLAPLHDAAKARGATLNDAVLSLVAGALGRWLEHHHGALGSVRLRVPVSLHHEGDHAGNRDSFFTLAAPLGEPDPLLRLEQIHAATAERKQEHDAETLEQLIERLGGISSRLAGFARRLEASPRSFALSVSNVPGPREPVSVLGAAVDQMFSVAEIGERHALRVSVISLADQLCFGFCADPAVVEDLSEMAQGIEAEAEALIASA